MEKREYAVHLKHSGSNCAQAVLCAFAEELNLPEETMKRLGAGFGVGMGCMEATCGALIAAQMLMGLARYRGRPMLREAREMYADFEARCGATLCRDLKGRDTGKPLCECDDCVRFAVDLVLRRLEATD